MTYRVVFDNNDFVDSGTSPSKVNGGAALSSSTNFGSTQTFDGPLINNKNLFVPYYLIYGPNGNYYDSSSQNMYVTESSDYVLRADVDGQFESLVLYNKSVGDIIIFKNTFSKSIGVFGSLYGNGTVNGSTGTWPSSPPVSVSSLSAATFLCVAANTWVTV